MTNDLTTQIKQTRASAKVDPQNLKSMTKERERKGSSHHLAFKHTQSHPLLSWGLVQKNKIYGSIRHIYNMVKNPKHPIEF